MRTLIIPRSLLACIVGFTCFKASTFAAEPVAAQDLARYEAVLASTPKLEWPAKAAGLVKDVCSEKRLATAFGVLQVVARNQPAALPPVVGAISKIEPKIAPTVASEATRLQPKLALRIQQAALQETTANFSAGNSANETDQAQAAKRSVSATRVAPVAAVDPPYKKGHYKSAWWPPPHNPHSDPRSQGAAN